MAKKATKPARKPAKPAAKRNAKPVTRGKAPKAPKTRQELIRERRAADIEAKLSIARGAAEAKRQQAEAERRRRPVEERLFKPLERIRDHVGGGLRAQRPPSSGIVVTPSGERSGSRASGTPWLLRGDYDLRGKGLSYLELGEALAKVRADRKITQMIGAERLARIQITYRGVEKRGHTKIVELDWTLAEISPWDACISRAVEQCIGVHDEASDEADMDSLHVRYPDTRVLRMFVWLSSTKAERIPF